MMKISCICIVSLSVLSNIQFEFEECVCVQSLLKVLDIDLLSLHTAMTQSNTQPLNLFSDIDLLYSRSHCFLYKVENAMLVQKS